MSIVTTMYNYFNPKKQAQRDMILARLQRGSVTNSELAKIGLRYSARIHELRQLGYNIETSTVKGGLMQYRLLGRVVS